MIMTNKQVKFGEAKRLQKAILVNEECEIGVSQRALLLSSDDVDRMAVQSCRARLINHLVSKSEDHYATREFASYYRGPTRYFEPPYSITSHTNRVFPPKALQVIPAYPSLVPPPQWCPYYRQMPEQISETDLMVNRTYNCRCAECRSADCPAKSHSRFRPRRIKDNIMTFCDQWTMTPNLNDVCCGTPIPATVEYPGVSVPYDQTLPVGGRDDLSKLKIYEMSKMGAYAPVPILKKGHTADTVNNDCCKTMYQEEVDDHEPPKTISAQYFYAKKEEDDRSSCTHSTRKNLYNEGISDVVLKFSSVPKKKPRAAASPGSAAPGSARSKAREPSEGATSSVDIPHSHRSDSRYHKQCANMSLDESDKRHVLVSSPRIIPCKICSRKRVQQQQHNIKLPKKLLTSEKLADACALKTKALFTRK